MSEINVLNMTQIMGNPSYCDFLSTIGITCLIIELIILFISVIKDNPKITTVVIAIILFIAGLFFIIFSEMHKNTVPTGKYKYEVTIDENVSFTELNSKYNIIEQRGDIYVLEDK